MSPNVVMTCCRDEEDIIDTFVRYYLAAGFDRVRVVDNGSRDGTVQRVKALAAAGLPVDVVVDPRDGYERHLTEWFHAAGNRWRPRWLFFLDCDEFILFQGSAKVYLDTLPPEVNRLRLRQKEMYPEPSPDPRPAGFLMSRRAETRFNDTTKDMVRWHPAARVYGGKHLIELPDAVTLEIEDPFIRHYKYRSLEQGYRKEQNRVANGKLYSDGDLARISAFDVARSRAWISHCSQALETGRWRASFAADIAYVDDPAMAAHAAGLWPMSHDPADPASGS